MDGRAVGWVGDLSCRGVSLNSCCVDGTQVPIMIGKTVDSEAEGEDKMGESLQGIHALL